ncbi:MAG: glycosyltransferase family 2 protein [Eubacteriales bacterium]|nr:glycosyltransferase family 2 protein [Eubacteriales bacterium]MDD3200329.1 glycosyltransferase family 2 protein [Eubacteriales bacterium]MDD4630540.1 glycosyltransferase family 2 protein [Eubacteriales bacterium]
MSNITVVLPAYNEEENIQTMVERWQQFREVLKNQYRLELQIIAVNDGSKDRTREIAEGLEKVHDNFKLVNHSHNKGLGQAMRTGIFYFLRECPDSTMMCLMDCDNTQDPVYITDMLDRMKESASDVVTASRYQKGAEVKGVSGIRLLMSSGAKYVFSVLLHVPDVKDYTCGYRLYSRRILLNASERFGEDLIEENGFTCMVELLYKLYSCGAVFAEIPFELRYDYKKGASKMAVLKTAVNSICLALRLKQINKA